MVTCDNVRRESVIRWASVWVEKRTEFSIFLLWILVFLPEDEKCDHLASDEETASAPRLRHTHACRCVFLQLLHWLKCGSIQPSLYTDAADESLLLLTERGSGLWEPGSQIGFRAVVSKVTHHSFWMIDCKLMFYVTPLHMKPLR